MQETDGLIAALRDRVTELIQANNNEVDRRRKAEAELEREKLKTEALAQVALRYKLKCQAENNPEPVMACRECGRGENGNHEPDCPWSGKEVLTQTK